jgi:hypothetical protein
MTENIPDAADCLRSEGWKQGCLIPPNSAERITKASIDFYQKGASSGTWLAILTQDCDLVRKVKDEPFVELLAMHKLPNKPSGQIMRGQSARTLHLTIEIDNQVSWFECSIHDRFRIKKESLCNLGCDTSIGLIENELRLLRQWLARRYTRAAFPDNFENHLASTQGRVKSLFKSAEAKLISTVYIAIDNEYAAPNEDYFIHVILTALAEDFEDAGKRNSIDDFEQRFIEVFSNRPHIRFALTNPNDAESVDVRVLPEEDVTLSILRKYKRFDADYRSVDDDTVSPPDGTDTN